MRWGHGVRSRAEGHMQGSRGRKMRAVQSDLHVQMGGVVTVRILQVKCKCQLAVKLKANKCY